MKNCGYPLCKHVLDEIPKQQYTISTTQNKVYDITERKKFCSNKCYKSSVYLKEQLLDTPLWIRKEDDIITEFKLLSFDDDDKKRYSFQYSYSDVEINTDEASMYPKQASLTNIVYSFCNCSSTSDHNTKLKMTKSLDKLQKEKETHTATLCE